MTALCIVLLLLVIAGMGWALRMTAAVIIMAGIIALMGWALLNTRDNETPRNNGSALKRIAREALEDLA